MFDLQSKFKHYPGDYELFGLYLLHSTCVRVKEMMNISFNAGFFRIFCIGFVCIFCLGMCTDQSNFVAPPAVGQTAHQPVILPSVSIQHTLQSGSQTSVAPTAVTAMAALALCAMMAKKRVRTSSTIVSGRQIVTVMQRQTVSTSFMARRALDQSCRYADLELDE